MFAVNATVQLIRIRKNALAAETSYPGIIKENKMDYFATFNPLHKSVNENILIAIKHYDISAMFVMMLILACFVAIIGLKLNMCSYLCNIEQRKIYGRCFDDE